MELRLVNDNSDSKNDSKIYIKYGTVEYNVDGSDNNILDDLKKFNVNDFKADDYTLDGLIDFDMIDGVNVVDSIYVDSSISVDKLKEIVNNNNDLFSVSEVVVYLDCFLDEQSLKNIEEIYFLCPHALFEINGIGERVDFNFLKNIFTILSSYVDMNILNVLSPLEKIVYIYDVTRAFKYKDGDQSDFRDSRSLSRVLFNDNIVCAGFISIFNQLLHMCGIRSKKYSMCSKSNNEDSHVRSIVYLEDEKYDVRRIVFCDPTWDSRFDDTNRYLFTYRFFCNTFNKMVELDKNNFDYSNDLIDCIESVSLYKGLGVSKNDINFFTKKTVLKMLYNNFYKELISGSKPSSPFDKVEDAEIDDVYDMLLKPIHPRILMLAINNVRKLMHYQNPNLYPYSENALYCIIKNSKFEDYRTDQRELCEFLDEEFVERYIPIDSDGACNELMLDLVIEDNVDVDICRIQFLNSLRDFARKKQNEEQTKFTEKKL